MTPVIGQPQHENTQPIYQNSNVTAKPTAGKGRWARFSVFRVTWPWSQSVWKEEEQEEEEEEGEA